MKNAVALASAGLLSTLAAVASATAAASQESFTIDTLFKLERVTGAAISPTGDQVAVVTERWTDKSYWATNSTLWLVSTKGGKVRRAVEEAGELSQSKPLWSPDGQKLAYTAKGEKESKLRVISFGGKQTVSTLSVCAEKENIVSLTWSPDARQMALICEVPFEWKVEKPPTIIVSSESKLFRGVADSRTQRRVVLFDLATGSGKEVAKKDAFLAGEGVLIWKSPESLWIVGTPDKDYAGMDFVSGRLLTRYDVTAGKIASVTQELPGSRVPALSPEGREFMMPIGGTVGDDDWRTTWRLIPMQVQRFDLNGKPLSAVKLDQEIYLGRSAKQVWAPAPDKRAGGVYYTQWLDRASGRVKAFYPGSGQWSDITPADVNVEQYSVSADGTQMALVQGDANTPSEVYVLDLKKPAAKPVRLTRFEEGIRSTYAVSSVEKMQWRSKDDRFTISGWLVKPANYEKGKRYPLILDVHGGPGVAFRNSFDAFHFDGAHQVAPELYAARGYMVLMVNPRGDPGYGRAHLEALLEGWPPATINDLFTGVDEAIRRGYADPDKLGIGGASYGGWVTTFAVSASDRFKAASANDPVIDSNISSAVAYRGDRESNYWLHAGFAQGHSFEKPFESVNPKTVNTPILLRFGLREEAPFPSQFFVSGLPYFTYLDTHCKPVEMIMHPEEGHGVFNWTTLRDYIQRDLAWFDYFVKGEGENPLPKRSCPKQ